MRLNYKGFADLSASFKAKKVLFRSLQEKADASGLKTKERSLSKSSTDSDKQTTEFDAMLHHFPDLEKFDSRNITLYDEEDLESKCTIALEHLKLFIDKLAFESSPKIVKDEVVKVFVICFNRVTKHLVSHILGESVDFNERQMVEQLLTLNQFLLFTLGERKSPIILGQYDISIVKVAKEALDLVHKQLTAPDKCKDKLLIATFLCYQFQIVAMMVALNEGRSFMKTAATESIKDGFEIFGLSLKGSLNNPILKEIYKTRLGNDETWISLNQEHVKVAVGFEKVKFYMVQLSPAIRPPQFSLRYMTLFYILKFLQLISLDDNPSVKEHVLELVASILKDNLNLLEEESTKKDLSKEELADVEIAFTECLTCFNLIKRTAPKAGDPSALLDRLGYMHFLKPAIESYLRLALKLSLVVTFDAETKWESVSYKTTRDYVAGVFSFLSKVKNAKDPASLARISRSSSAATILTLVEETVGNIIRNVDSVQGSESELQVLKAYIAEYLFDNRHTMSRQTAEHVIKLISSKQFHYTSPKLLKAFADSSAAQTSPLEKITNKRIITLLQHIIEYDKNWAEIILQHLVKLIPELLSSEESLFGLCKLIYCGVTGEFHDNASFYEKVFGASYEPLTFQSYSRIEPRWESKAIKGFIDIRGVAQLVETLLVRFYKDGVKLVESDRVIRIVETLFLELIGLPLISQQLLGEIPLVTTFLDYVKVGPDPNRITAKFLEKLLAAIKYKQKSHDKIHDLMGERSSYLPLHIVGFVRAKFRQTQTHDVALAIPFLELLVRFVSQETKAPSVRTHQIALSNIINLEELFELQRRNMSAPYIGRIIKVLLMLLGKLQENNETVVAKVNSSSLITKKEIFSFLKELVHKVLLGSDL